MSFNIFFSLLDFNNSKRCKFYWRNSRVAPAYKIWLCLVQVPTRKPRSDIIIRLNQLHASWKTAGARRPIAFSWFRSLKAFISPGHFVLPLLPCKTILGISSPAPDNGKTLKESVVLLLQECIIIPAITLFVICAPEIWIFVRWWSILLRTLPPLQLDAIFNKWNTGILTIL